MEHNKSVLLINNVQVADSGVYTCRAVSEVGEAISSTTLYVTGEWSSCMQRPVWSSFGWVKTSVDGEKYWWWVKNEGAKLKKFIDIVS